MRSFGTLWWIAVLVLATPASAHLLNMSRATVSLEEDSTVVVTLELDILTTIGGRQAYFELSQTKDPLSDPDVLALLNALPDAIEINVAEYSVPLTISSIRFPADNQETFLDPLQWPRTTITLRGTQPEPVASASTGLTVRFNSAFFFEEPIATTVADTTSGRTQTRWLVTGQRSPVSDAAEWLGQPSRIDHEATTSASVIVDYLLAGLRHILPGGFDHLLFVVGLLLAARSTRNLLITVSLFTLAHSITLIIGALGWVDVSPWLVEPLILASIVWIGITNTRLKATTQFDRVVVFGFGLLHGLGFAGALRELSLPSESVLSPLLAFSIGVELGQLVFIGAVLAMYALFRAAMGRSQDTLLPMTPSMRRSGGVLIATVSIGLLARLLFAL